MFTFPLSCSTLYQFVFTTDFTWASSGGIHTNWFRSTSSTTSSVTFGDAQRRRIIILCKQQWGYVEIGSVNATKTITFPISYTTIYGAVIGEINIYEEEAYGLRIMSISKSELKIFGWDNVSGYWLVIGIQQWGYFDDGNQLSSEGNTRIFPLSMSNVYAISAIRLYSLRTDRHGLISLKSYTTSQAVFQGSVWDNGGGTSNNTAGTFFWFVVGKQQWENLFYQMAENGSRT